MASHNFKLKNLKMSLPQILSDALKAHITVLASAIAEEYGIDAESLSVFIEKTSGVQVNPIALSPPVGKGVYAITSCAIILAGETKDIKDHLNSLNPPANGKKAVAKKVVYIPSSPVGPCWAVLDPSCMSSIEGELKKKKLLLTKCSVDEYNDAQNDDKPKNTVVKSTKKAQTAVVVDVKGKNKAQTAVVDVKGKNKKTSSVTTTQKNAVAKPSASTQKGKRHEVSKNAWDNNEDPDSGIVFVELPVGANGVKVAVAVGTQKKNARKTEKGLKTVEALTSEKKKVCEENKWRILDQNMLTKIKNPPLVVELKTLLTAVKETNTSTSKNKADDSDDDNDSDSDDSDDDTEEDDSDDDEDDDSGGDDD